MTDTKDKTVTQIIPIAPRSPTRSMADDLCSNVVSSAEALRPPNASWHDGIAWSEWRPYTNQDGVKLAVRSGTPSQPFWDAWLFEWERIKAHGYDVRQTPDGAWQILQLSVVSDLPDCFGGRFGPSTHYDTGIEPSPRSCADRDVTSQTRHCHCPIPPSS